MRNRDSGVGIGLHLPRITTFKPNSAPVLLNSPDLPAGTATSSFAMSAIA
uniref:Uncharacterized protein n=1 Tax=Physcomitrium patens TaxID=3218 RepID=A0A2K1IVP7_PHYPA|nr:hypothetical protein PHYPA_025289 [Physcomitrium patens]